MALTNAQKQAAYRQRLINRAVSAEVELETVMKFYNILKQERDELARLLYSGARMEPITFSTTGNIDGPSGSGT